MSFQVGDRVEVVYAPKAPEFVGQQCSILSGPDSRGMYQTDIPAEGYPGHPYWMGKAHSFRKIDDGQVSWEAIEKLTKWNPMHVETLSHDR